VAAEFDEKLLVPLNPEEKVHIRRPAARADEVVSLLHKKKSRPSVFLRQ